MAIDGRSMGVDVGDVRIGIAMSDPMGIIVSPHSTLDAQDTDADVAATVQLVHENDVKRVVVGLPLDQNGEMGPQANKIMKFVDALRDAIDIDVHTQDERFTSAIVERALRGTKAKKKKGKGIVDQMAAQQILQTWLDRASRGNA